MEINAWTHRLRSLYDKAVHFQSEGQTNLETYFTSNEIEFLSSIGLRPINLYDFAEDFIESNEPDWDTFLLIAAARRDFFLYEQNGKPNPAEIASSELPGREATLDGIKWLPRIIAKGRCFLEGGLCDDIMFSCGGDRHFLKTHHLHPADFLRAIWAAKGDDQKILAFVKKTEKRASNS